MLSHSERKLVTDPDPGCGTILTDCPAVKSNPRSPACLQSKPAYVGYNITEFSSFILLKEGQNISEILSRSSKFNCLCYFSTMTCFGEYNVPRGRRSLQVSSVGVCEWVVVSLNSLVLIVDEYYPSRRMGCVHEDVAWAVCFSFLWLRIIRQKTTM